MNSLLPLLIKVKVRMRMWRNWQTRRFQVPVGDHAGSSPVIRTIYTGYCIKHGNIPYIFCRFG